MIVYQGSKRAKRKKKEIKERKRERKKERKREKGTTKYLETEKKQIQRLLKRAHSRDDRYKVIKYNDCLPAIFGVCQV